VIQGNSHNEKEIQVRWFRAINTRLMDKIRATQIKREQTFTERVKSTSAPILSFHAAPERLAKQLANQ
jgi:hypothetical protein